MIVRVGEREMDSTKDLVNAIVDLRKGERVEVEMMRDGRSSTVCMAVAGAG